MNKQKTAVIVVGEIRNESPNQKEAWEKNLKSYSGDNIFFATYTEYIKHIPQDVSKISHIERPNINSHEYLNFPTAKKKKGEIYLKNNLWQHIHLSRALKEIKELKNFDYILKTRTDSASDIHDCINLIEKRDGFHMNTDWTFGCEKNLFYKMFANDRFIEYIKLMFAKDKYYMPIHFSNLKKSLNLGSRRFRWSWFNYPANLTKVEEKDIIDFDTNLTASPIDLPVDIPTITKKPFNTVIANEKLLALYALTHSHIRDLEGKLIRK